MGRGELVMSCVDLFVVLRRLVARCRSLSMLLLVSCTVAAGSCDKDKNPTGPSGIIATSSPGGGSTMYALNVLPSPAAGGSITKSPNQSQFAAGAFVTLNATPASGYQFTGWQGDASGTANPLTVKMDARP
jgi:hypothetical protein